MGISNGAMVRKGSNISKSSSENIGKHFWDNFGSIQEWPMEVRRTYNTPDAQSMILIYLHLPTLNYPNVGR